MTATSPSKAAAAASLLGILPAKYAKFVTSAVGLLVVYLQAYGSTWHLVPAVMAIAAAFGVAGVPNKAAAPAPAPAPAPSPPAPPGATV